MNPIVRWWKGPQQPERHDPPSLRISQGALDRFRKKKPVVNPFVLPTYAPGVKGKSSPDMLAMDEAWSSQVNSVYGAQYGSLYGEGLAFMGYPYLAELTQRSEYRRPSEVIAEEMTRKWITLKATGKTDKSERIAQLTADMKTFRLRHTFREALELDGFMGISQIGIDLGNTDDTAEMQTPLILSKAKIKKGSLKGFRVIDPTWIAPNRYETTNPMSAHFYKPQIWFLMGVQYHTTRLITLTSRPVPDILKPAYNFGGISLSQLMKPTVDNWLRTRQSVSDLLNAFTVFTLETNMQAFLEGGVLTSTGSSSMEARATVLAGMRDNTGILLIDKETEALNNTSAPLGTLDHLQAQSQEHMSATNGIPLVKAFGITPSGLNASSDGEIRCFYDSMRGRQERVMADPLKYLLDILQLNRYGDIDEDISIEFEPLWQLDEAGVAAVYKTRADTAAVYIETGVLDPEDERTRIAAEPGNPYMGLEGEAPGMPEEGEQSPDLTDPSERIDTAAENGSMSGANSGDMAMDFEFNESDHPRSPDGKFGSGSNAPPTKEQHSALKSYTGATYRQINGHLRGGIAITEAHREEISHLDKFLGDASTPADTVVHRGLGSLAVQQLVGAGLKKGSVIEDPGFASTTQDKRVAQQFLQVNPKNIMMTIRVPKGSKAADISKYSDDPSERETLFARNSKMKVVKFDPKARTLEVELMPHDYDLNKKNTKPPVAKDEASRKREEDTKFAYSDASGLIVHPPIGDDE